MDWWTGINSANTGASSSGSLADHINQIDTNCGIFDPWLNCDDLDLGTILHQASGNSYHVSGASNSTTTTSTTTTNAATAADSLPSSVNDQPMEGADNNASNIKCNGQHQQGFSNYMVSSYATQDNNNNLIVSQQQQPQMSISTPSSASNSSNNKQNIFNFITSSASSETTPALASNSPTADHQHSPTKGRQSTLLSNQNNNNNPSVINCTNSLASSTTSPLSSASTCELSPLSTPLNTSQISAINYLSSSPSSSTTSSLLINDNNCHDVKPAILHATGNNQHSNQRHLTSGLYHNYQTADHSRHQNKFAAQHQARDVDSKSNLENLLHSNSGKYSGREQNNEEMQVSSQSVPNASTVGQSISSQQSQSSSTSSKCSNKSKTSDSATTTTTPKLRRCRHITDFVLADEEKRLLIKEGYSDFPMSCQARPLTKAEERILRKIRRKIRNKKSAQCSRQRKKEYVEDLERKYAAVIRENDELKHLLSRIQHQPSTTPFDQSMSSINNNNNHHHQQQLTNELNEPLELDWKDLFPSSMKIVHQQNHHQLQHQQQQPNIYN